MNTPKIVWLLSYVSIAAMSSAIISPAIPEIQHHFALSLGAVDWIMSAFLIGNLIGLLIYGPLANRYGRVNALRIGLSINLIGIIICLMASFVDNFGIILIGRFITALGAASGLTCTFILINEWLPKVQRKIAIAYSIVSFAVGTGVAVLIGGLITEYLNWQACFLFLLGQGILMLYGTRVFSETLVTPKMIDLRTILYDYSAALSSPILLIFSLVIGCMATIMNCFYIAGPQIAESILKLSPAHYGYWSFLNTIGMLFGGILSKKLLASFQSNTVIAIGFFGMALGIVNLFIIWQLGSESVLWFFLTSATLYCFGSFLYSGGSLIASNALADKASSSAVMSFVFLGFSTVWVILMGYLGTNALVDYIIILSLIWLIVFILFVTLTAKNGV